VAPFSSVDLDALVTLGTAIFFRVVVGVVQILVDLVFVVEAAFLVAAAVFL
jgi:hypothetical protein